MHLHGEEIKKYGIETAFAGTKAANITRELQGELKVNSDRTAHIVPRVSGIVTGVSVNLGDRIESGQAMAVIESAELADMKASYLASEQRLEITAAEYRREKDLREEGISSEAEYLQARRAYTEAAIGRRNSRQKLLALGFDERYLGELSAEPAAKYTEYTIRAPFDGTIISKHITPGEAVEKDADILTITDLDTVWADLYVYQSDKSFIESGQKAIIRSRDGRRLATGNISMINPVVDRSSRTMLARVVLDNSSGELHPGTFITAIVETDSLFSSIVIDRDIIQEIDNSKYVFVRTPAGFESRLVRVGRSNGKYAEIIEGLCPGEEVAVKNSFMLKAELTKSAGGGHGHSH